MYRSYQRLADRMAHIVDKLDGRVSTAAEIASELNISERTVYRYVKHMRSQGEAIQSEKGVGYMIRKRRPSQAVQP